MITNIPHLYNNFVKIFFTLLLVSGFFISPVLAQTFDARKNEILNWASARTDTDPKFAFWYAQAKYEKGNISGGNSQALDAIGLLNTNDPAFQLWGAMECYLRWNQVMDQNLKNQFKTKLTTTTQWSNHNTSNKQMMSAAGRYLAQQTWPGESFASNYSASDPTGEIFLNDITDRYVHIGQREHNSPTYFVFHYGGLRSVADFATNAGLQNKAKLTAEWLMTSAAVKWLSGHWVAASERTRVPFRAQNEYRGATMPLWLHYDGPNPLGFDQFSDHAFSVQSCVSDFRVPAIFNDIANDRSTDFTHKELHKFTNQMRFYLVSYLTNDWGLYSQHEAWTGNDFKANLQFQRWAVNWKKPSGKSTFFIKNPYNDNNDNGETEWEQVLQNKGTLVGVYDLSSATRKFVKGWVPTNYTSVINNASSTGRVYLDYGTIKMAFVLTQTFNWTSSSETFQKNSNSDIGLVVEVVSGSDYASLNAFKSAVDPKFDAISFSSGPAISYAALDGTTLETSYRNFDKINGTTVSYTTTNWPLLGNQWMNQDYDGDILTISKGGQTRTYDFLNWTVSTSGGGNTPPSASITSPSNAAIFNEGDTVTINANASDPDGTVTKVEFFQGSTIIGEDTSSPYSFNWTNVAAGSYSLTARATDNNGATTTSGAVNITVNNTGGGGPTTTYQAENATVGGGAAIESSNFGYNGTGYINFPSNGGSAQFDNVDGGSGGTATLTYRYALGNSNRTGNLIVNGVNQSLTMTGTGSWTSYNSVNLSVTLNSGTTNTIRFESTGQDFGNLDEIIIETAGGGTNNPPTVSITSPSNGTGFTEGDTITINANASDPDGSVTKVEFFQGSTIIGEDTSSPYSFNWINVAAGSYSLTVRATDNNGATTTSSVISINVNSAANNPPVVNVTSPSNGAGFAEGDTIVINASATDSDGSVTKVEFFEGSTKLGEDTTSPYSFTWSNVSAGSYSLTAKATDNGAAVTSSSVVSITVNTSGGGGNPDLEVFWKFDETSGTIASDDTSNGRDGTLQGGLSFATNAVAGKYQNALDFDGTDDVVRLSNGVVTGFPFTLSAWVKFTGTNKMMVVYLGNGNAFNQYFTIGVKSGKGLIVGRNTSSQELTGSANINDNQWHLITGVFESNTNRKLYVDGQLEGTNTNSVSFISNTNRFSSGALDRSSLADRFNGAIDDVRLYSNALTAAEVSNLYNATSSAKISLEVPVTKDEVLIYPNPAKNKLQMLYNSAYKTSAHIMILDLQGRKIKELTTEFKKDSNNVELDVSLFSNGLYFLNMKTAEQQVLKKIRIEN